MGFVFEKILCRVLSPNSAETPLQNYMESATQLYKDMYSVLYHCLTYHFQKEKKGLRCILKYHTHLTYFLMSMLLISQKKEQAVNSLDSKNTKKLIPFMNISNTSRLKSLQNEQASE